MVSGAAWALAIWVSAYEPLVLFTMLIVVGLFQDRHLLSGKDRRVGWITFVAVVALALVIEQRISSFAILHPNEIFRNWSRTIGELLPVRPWHQVWFRWAGYMLVVAPILIWIAYRKKILPPIFIIVLLVASYGLTIWQARWSYFFVVIFAMTLPSLLETVRSRAAVWLAFSLSIFPILRDWDEKLWPNEEEMSLRLERRREGMELRDLATTMRSSQVGAFIAPWWLSPEIAYWSGQPGVAGSSHESLDGIADTARFFLAANWEDGRAILERRNVAWVVGYDGERVARNSAAVLAATPPGRPLCQILSRTPAQAPFYLVFSAQNQTAKIYRFANNR